MLSELDRVWGNQARVPSAFSASALARLESTPVEICFSTLAVSRSMTLTLPLLKWDT
jgi:hypothetical protein